MEFRATNKNREEQNPAYEYMLRCADDFDALHLRPELADAMEEYAIKKSVAFSQDYPVVLEEFDVPVELRDAFYFPDQPTISGMHISFTDTFEASRGGDDTMPLSKIIGGSFYVHDTHYMVSDDLDEHLVISTQGSDGSWLSYKTPTTTMLELMAAMYARQTVRNFERDVHADEETSEELIVPFSAPTKSEMQTMVKHLVGSGDWFAQHALLVHLSESLGKTTVDSTALLQPSGIDLADPQRAVLITLSDTTQGSLENTTMTTHVNWEMNDSHFEVSASTNHITDNRFTPAPAIAQVRPGKYAHDDFAFGRELEREEISVFDTDTTLITPGSPQWLNATSIIMTSINPYLDKYGANYTVDAYNEQDTA